MLQKLKDAWLWIVGALGAIIGLLWFFLASKNARIDELNARIALAETQKQADLLELEIKNMMQEKGLLKKELDELSTSMLLLSEQRRRIAAVEEGKTPDEIEDHWNS